MRVREITMSDKRGVQLTKSYEEFQGRIQQDINGCMTVGWGHVLRPNSFFPKDAAQILFRHDYETAELDYNQLGLSLDSVRRMVIIDLLFTWGLLTMLDADRLLAALKRRDFESAAQELRELDFSLRIRKNARILQTGLLDVDD